MNVKVIFVTIEMHYLMITIMQILIGKAQSFIFRSGAKLLKLYLTNQDEN